MNKIRRNILFEQYNLLKILKLRVMLEVLISLIKTHNFPCEARKESVMLKTFILQNPVVRMISSLEEI